MIVRYRDGTTEEVGPGHQFHGQQIVDVRFTIGDFPIDPSYIETELRPRMVAAGRPCLSELKAFERLSVEIQKFLSSSNLRDCYEACQVASSIKVELSVGDSRETPLRRTFTMTARPS
jgi:hypothetical protein